MSVRRLPNYPDASIELNVGASASDAMGSVARAIASWDTTANGSEAGGGASSNGVRRLGCTPNPG